MDKLASKIAGLGVPSIIFVYYYKHSIYTGAAAFTSAFSAIGPGGMIGGVATLGFIGLLSSITVEQITPALYKAVIAKHLEK